MPEEEREKGTESVFEEIIDENFPKLGKEIVSQTMEAHRSPTIRDPRRPSPRNMIKMTNIKDKDRVLKATRERKKDHPQRKTHQAIIRLHSKNLTVQKGMS